MRCRTGWFDSEPYIVVWEIYMDLALNCAYAMHF
jgi:hypothetical protein